MEKAKIAARFMAFTWYLNLEPAPAAGATDAAAFAQEHGDEFLPLVSEELGQLLTQKSPLSTKVPQPHKQARAQRKQGGNKKMALVG